MPYRAGFTSRDDRTFRPATDAELRQHLDTPQGGTQRGILRLAIDGGYDWRLVVGSGTVLIDCALPRDRWTMTRTGPVVVDATPTALMPTPVLGETSLVAERETPGMLIGFIAKWQGAKFHAVAARNGWPLDRPNVAELRRLLQSRLAIVADRRQAA